MSAEDKIEIQELACRYANAVDDAELNEWMDTWDKNGLWVGRLGEFQGTEKLKELWDALGKRAQNMRHVMTNFVIKVEGEKAQMRCTLLFFDRIEEARLMATGIYQDLLIKKGGKWKFVERRVNIDPSFRPL